VLPHFKQVQVLKIDKHDIYKLDLILKQVITLDWFYIILRNLHLELWALVKQINNTLKKLFSSDNGTRLNLVLN
jgi:hypothetical protein